MSQDVRTLLALSRLPRIGRAKIRQVLARSAATGVDFPSVASALDFLGISFSAAAIDIALGGADHILDQCQSRRIDLHVHGSENYPSELNRLSQPPAILFSLGHFDPEHRQRIAVIGTRQPTPWGRKAARACTRQIVSAGCVVVSGLALGIDTEAHTTAIASRGVTWAVLPHGLSVRPATASQKLLAERILGSGGALASEYPPEEPSQRHYFVQRDRIQAGLSDAVLLIESELDGGAMHTVRFARQAHVPVWVTLSTTAQDPAHDKVPNVQQGPLQEFRERRATHIESTGALARAIRSLPVVGRQE